MAVVWDNPSRMNSVAVCSLVTEVAGTELPTSLTEAVRGLELGPVTSFQLCVESQTQGNNLSPGGQLQAYWWCPHTGRWVRNPENDFTLPAGAYDAICALFNKVAGQGRYAFLPFGVGQPTNVRMLGSRS